MIAEKNENPTLTALRREGRMKKSKKSLTSKIEVVTKSIELYKV